MLLCDLCYSPAHTYCVGLGHEVPEGNWYFYGCRPATLGSTHYATGITEATSSYENMAEIDLNVSTPETPVSQGNGIFPSPRFSNGSFQAPSPVSGLGISTVSGRRMIHAQIRRHLLSSRFSQISPREHNRSTDVGPSHRDVDKMQENSSHSVQNRGSFPGSVGNMMRGLGQPSTSANGFGQTQGQWSGLDRLNLGDGESRVTFGEQLLSCTDRSNVGVEMGVSTSDQRYGEQTNFLKQQVHVMVRTQLKSLSRDMNLDKFI